MNPLTISFNYARWFLRYLKLQHQYRQANGPLREGGQWRWFFPWVRSVSGNRSALSERLPWLTFESIQVLRHTVRPGWRVGEFGMGGSTLFFADRGSTLLSIDHDDLWVRKVSENMPPSPAWEPRLVPPQAVPPGAPLPEATSGFPGYEGMDFSAYAAAIDPERDASFDLILVDGRSRVQAALHSLPKLKPGGLLIMDNSERPRYRPLHEQLQSYHWPVQHFPGPTPAVKTEFTQTSFWTKPER